MDGSSMGPTVTTSRRVRSRTLSGSRAALVAALVGVGALIAIPIGPVPVTLQVLVAAVAVLVLSPAEAMLSLTLYVALGALGLPIFSGGGSGIGVLLGPTGGFVCGFVIGAPAGAMIRRVLARRGLIADIAGVALFVLIVYAAGLLWFAHVTETSLAGSFAIAVLPFVPFDLVKALAALAVARAVRSAGLGDTGAVA